MFDRTEIEVHITDLKSVKKKTETEEAVQDDLAACLEEIDRLEKQIVEAQKEGYKAGLKGAIYATEQQTQETQT